MANLFCISRDNGDILEMRENMKDFLRKHRIKHTGSYIFVEKANREKEGLPTFVIYPLKGHNLSERAFPYRDIDREDIIEMDIHSTTFKIHNTVFCLYSKYPNGSLK